MDKEITLQDKTMKQKVLTVLALGLPAMVENILQTVVGFIDTLFVSKLGLNEVTAVGLANGLLAVYIAIFIALGVGTSSLIARSLGAGDIEKAKVIARQSTIISSIIGLAFGLITLLFSKKLLSIMGAEEKVLDHAVTYFQIVGVSSIFISLMFIFGSILRASGDTKTPMKVGWWINIIHIGLDYVLIFGIFGMEGLGVAGAAWATVVVRIIGTVALYRYIKKSKISFPLFSIKSKTEYSSILKISTPAAIERLVMRLGQVLYFGLIVKIGAETYAAHSIAGNIETFAYMPGYGLAIAAATLVGQSIGASRKKDAYQYGMISTGIAVAFMSFVGIIMYILAPWFASWFTTDENAIEMVVTALRIDAFAQPALAVGLVLAGALQGAGDTKSPMYSTAIGMWIIRVIGIYILGINMEMGIAGVWISIAIDLYVRAIFLLYRFKYKTN
ncbi:MATE family efflux transporter [Niallia circulans]|uniref:MATE family efflux transporter n=1 Tax=Niallia circulans TaxID=1397 RepID=UPI001C3F0A2C|nr:MATE family efflux transporter [Niallia circulans]